MAAALCYFVPVVTGALFLFLEPYNRNKNIRFHAFQSIFFWIGVLLADAAVDIVFGGILGGPNSYELLRLVWTIFRLGVLGLWLVLMYMAYNRSRRWVPPVVEKWRKSLPDRTGVNARRAAFLGACADFPAAVAAAVLSFGLPG